jgi:hypothetical protein
MPLAFPAYIVRVLTSFSSNRIATPTSAGATSLREGCGWLGTTREEGHAGNDSGHPIVVCGSRPVADGIVLNLDLQREHESGM